MLQNVFEEKEKLVKNEANARAEVKDLKARLLSLEAQKDAQVKEHLAALDKAKADLADVQAKAKEQYDEISAKNTNRGEHGEGSRYARGRTRKNQRRKDGRRKPRTPSWSDRSRSCREGLPEVDQFAQPSDGRVTWVNQRYGKVWIDLGSSDGLRPQVTFSIAAEGNADAEKRRRRARSK